VNPEFFFIYVWQGDIEEKQVTDSNELKVVSFTFIANSVCCRLFKTKKFYSVLIYIF
jgi:hypothetical protein